VVLAHVYGDRRTSAQLHRLLDEGGEFYTIDVIVCEALSRGTAGERNTISRLLDALIFVPTTPELARKAAEVRRRRPDVSLGDALLTAHAGALGAEIVRARAARPALQPPGGRKSTLI
jgi:predicted nucleic acid-binding protein